MKKNYICFLFCIFMCGKFAAQVPAIQPITGPSTLCTSPANPETFSTSASNATYYTWFVIPSNGVIISNPSSPVTTIDFPEAASSYYTVYCTASNPFGSSPAVSKTVHVYEMPTVTFSGNMYLCQGSTTILMASPTIQAGSSTISYDWSPSSSLSDPNSPYVFASPAATTTYTLLLSVGACTNTEQVTITVGPCYTGLESLNADDSFLAYPNPNNGTFTIMSDKQETITIVNELGQLMRSMEALPGYETKITDLPRGIYFILTPTQRRKIIVTKE